MDSYFIQHLETESFVEGKILRLLGFKVSRLNFAITPGQYRHEKFTPKSLALSCGVYAKKSEIPMWLFRMSVLDCSKKFDPCSSITSCK
jgi:hypothetical protein